MPRRFFCPRLDREGGKVRLTAGETRHMLAVLRLKEGDAVVLFDGRGNEAPARFAGLEGDRALLDVLEIIRIGDTKRSFSCPRLPITVATAIPKGKRMAQLVRSCTEVGVKGIRPMIASRSVVRPEAGRAPERWGRVALQAAKQCGRAEVPEISPVTSFEKVVESAGSYGLALIALVAAEPSAGARPSPGLWRAPSEALPAGRQASPEEGASSLGEAVVPAEATETLLIIGPEGGFTSGELELARSGGVRTFAPGFPVMRVETAAPVLAGLVAYVLAL